MDHYNEQLVNKTSEPKDIVIRVLIIAGGLAIAGLSVYASFIFSEMLGYFPMIIGLGAICLAYWLLGNTVVEYEYIITNHDLDIDKIIGRRKRKRLISINLNNVEEWGEYTGKEGSGVNATVMAGDATGVGTWYLVAGHDKVGKVLVLFTPNIETQININHGVPYHKKNRAVEALAKEKEEAEAAAEEKE